MAAVVPPYCGGKVYATKNGVFTFVNVLFDVEGAFLCTLDGDLQNDPAELPRMLGLLVLDEVDFVCGQRVNRQDSWVRKVSSRVARAVSSAISGSCESAHK